VKLHFFVSSLSSVPIRRPRILSLSSFKVQVYICKFKVHADAILSTNWKLRCFGKEIFRKKIKKIQTFFFETSYETQIKVDDSSSAKIRFLSIAPLFLHRSVV
jgi:hypothetical protein